MGGQIGEVIWRPSNKGIWKSPGCLRISRMASSSSTSGVCTAPSIAAAPILVTRPYGSTSPRPRKRSPSSYALMCAKSATRPRSPGTVQTTSRAKRMSRVHDISDGTVVVRKRRRGSFCLSIVQVRRMLSSNPGFADDAPSARDRRAGCEWMRSRTGFAPHRSGDGRWR